MLMACSQQQFLSWHKHDPKRKKHRNVCSACAYAFPCVVCIFTATCLPGAKASAIDAPVTVMLMLHCAYVVVKSGFNVHCYVLKLDFLRVEKNKRESLS